MQGPSFELDLQRRVMTVVRSDDGVVDVRLPDGTLDFETNVERLSLDAREGALAVGLPGGATAVVELLDGGRTLTQCQASRPIVYLDQNHWSALSAWQHGRRQLPVAEATAAQELVRLVEERQILLPASAAHFVETTPLYGQPRVELGSTILALSRGWQMRNPLHVRLEELIRGLGSGNPAAGDVFAPCADQLFASPRRSPETAGLPPAMAELSAQMSAVVSLYDTIVDPDRIEDEGGAAEAAASRWARVHADLAQQLAVDKASRALAWRVVHGRLLTDLLDELRQAGSRVGLDPGQVIDRLGPPEGPLGAMPFLARYRHLLFARVRNVGQVWEANDLIDSIFLPCAAGYADIVIGERTAVGYMRQGRDLPAGAKLATTLSEGLGLLET